jgi:hypothetical protein
MAFRSARNSTNIIMNSSGSGESEQARGGKYEKVITGHLTVCENENDGDGGSIKSSRHLSIKIKPEKFSFLVVPKALFLFFIIHR